MDYPIYRTGWTVDIGHEFMNGYKKSYIHLFIHFILYRHCELLVTAWPKVEYSLAAF